MIKQLPSSEEAIQILIESGCSQNTIDHCKAVSSVAVKIAKRCRKNGHKVDIQLIRAGALLHDIGRSKTHSIHHPFVGAKIAREYCLPEQIILIIERHLGGGVTEKEALKFGWPKRSFIPKTIEEKIVTYSDKLIEGNKIISIEKTVKKLSNRLGFNHPSINRVLKLQKEISELCQ